MFQRRRRIFSTVCLGLSLALAGAACGGDDDDAAVDEAQQEGVTELPATTLDASGATFPQAFYEEAIAAFADVQPNVTVNYGGGGSGKGRQDLADGVVDWAGSDGLVKEEDRAKFKGEFLYFPTVTAPITVSYNLDGVDALRLTPATIARVFQREITKWDDPAIAEENPDADLPSTDITVAHRSDGSGTTENFTKFLDKAVPDVWKLGSGSTVNWPGGTQAGNGNTGVAQIVQSTDGAIGYVDLSDATATGLSIALVENKAGEFVEPTLEAASAALDGAEVNPDLSYDPLWADGAEAYPITAPTWILAYQEQTDQAKGQALKAFLEFVLTDAQDLAEEVDYAPLPAGLRDQALERLEELEIAGESSSGTDEEGTSSGSRTGSDSADLADATLNGSGATFPQSFYEEAIAAFADEHDNITVNYGGGGSGKGRQDLADGVVDWAGSDGLVKDEDRAKFKGEFLYFPTVTAPITVSYNLDEVEDLQLAPDTIAGIFQREITRWNDPAIAEDNPEIELPAEAITVAHRSDGSGTTENFTKFLDKAVPDVWKLGSGSTVNWPAGTQAGNGNTGVAQIVQSTDGAIGYVDLSDAKATGLAIAKVKNKAGNFVAPSLEAASFALDGAAVNADLSYDPLWADGAETYPITAPTWILVYQDQTDKAKAEALVTFLEFILTDAQDLAADVDYAKLPASLRDKALAQLDEIQIPT